jgi:O-antigen ligase
MNMRSIVASLTFVCALAAFLAWQYRAGQISGVAIGLFAITGVVIVAVARFFYSQMWRDDEDGP